MGVPTRASKEKGDIMLQALVKRFGSLLREMKNLPSVGEAV